MRVSETSNFLKVVDNFIEGDFDKALESLKKLILDGAEEPEYYIILGKIYRLDSFHEKAVQVHESVLNMRGLNKSARNINLKELALDYIGMTNYDRALSCIESIDKHYKDASVYKLQGDIYFFKKSFDEAVYFYRKYALALKKPAGKQISYCYFYKALSFEPVSILYYRSVRKGLKSYERSRKGNLLLIQYYYFKKEKRGFLDTIHNMVSKSFMKSDKDLIDIEKMYYDMDDVENLANFVQKNLVRDDSNQFYILFMAEFYNKKGKSDKAISILKNCIEKYDSSRLLFRKYAEITGNNMFNKLFDENNYKCIHCDSLYPDYIDICEKCNNIESIRPIYINSISLK